MNNATTYNASVKIIDGTSKAGKAYKCLEFSISVNGVPYSVRAFPTVLEMNAIENALKSNNNSFSEIYQ